MQPSAKQQLSFPEGVMLIAGAGLGTGILTLPYAINKIGIFGTFCAFITAYTASLFLSLIIADLTLNSEEPTELSGILREHLFSGPRGRFFSAVFFVILIIMLVLNLVVYILCACNVLSSISGLPETASKIIFYVLASLVVVFGVKGIGIGEKFSVTLMAAVILGLSVLSLFNVRRGFDFSFGEPKLVFAVYGLFMFAFSAIFAVIQVCNNLKDKRKIKSAVVGGLTLNAALTLLFAAAAILGSEKITEIATVGISDSLGIGAVRIACAVFVLLAMFSSYWSGALAFSDVLAVRFKAGRTVCWLAGTLPTLLIAVLLPLSILDYIQIGAGTLSVILVLVVLPAYYNERKKSQTLPLTGKYGNSRLFVFTVGFAICLMAVSSLIPID